MHLVTLNDTVGLPWTRDRHLAEACLHAQHIHESHRYSNLPQSRQVSAADVRAATAIVPDEILRGIIYLHPLPLHFLWFLSYLYLFPSITTSFSLVLFIPLFISIHYHFIFSGSFHTFIYLHPLPLHFLWFLSYLYLRHSFSRLNSELSYVYLSHDSLEMELTSV